MCSINSACFNSSDLSICLENFRAIRRRVQALDVRSPRSEVRLFRHSLQTSDLCGRSDMRPDVRRQTFDARPILRNLAFTATITVDSDIKAAPTAGPKRIPKE